MAIITLTTPAGQDARVLSAIGKRLNLLDGQGAVRSATAPEAKQYLLDYLIMTVKEVEAATARQVAEAGVTPITPT